MMSDRYLALRIPYPNPATMCRGQCEGTGVYPLSVDYRNWAGVGSMAEEIRRWTVLHYEGHGFLAFFRMLRQGFGLRFSFEQARRCDGWHLITCPDCGGSGKR